MQIRKDAYFNIIVTTFHISMEYQRLLKNSFKMRNANHNCTTE